MRQVVNEIINIYISGQRDKIINKASYTNLVGQYEISGQYQHMGKNKVWYTYLRGQY